MNANQIISGLNSEFLSSENIESLVYLNEEVIGCSLPYSAYIKKEYGEIDGKKIVSAIENMKKNNSNNITPEELLIMLENDIDNEDINGWNGRLVEYEGCVVEAWDVQLEETIYKIKRRIKKVSRMASEREKQKLKAVSTFKNNINDIVSEDDDNPRLTYIADPFKDDYILTGGNSCYVGFLSWDGTRDIKKNDFYSIADIKVRDCIVADSLNPFFVRSVFSLQALNNGLFSIICQYPYGNFAGLKSWLFFVQYISLFCVFVCSDLFAF